MAENKQYITQIQENGNVMISEDVVATIVEHTLTEVEGVVKGGAEVVGKKSWGKGIRIAIAEDNSLTIGCNIVVAYGESVMDVAKAVNEAKAGKIEYRLDKTNIIHCPIGKASFGAEKILDNFNALVGAVIKAKPASAKGQYIKSCVVASTMGPGVKINSAKLGV